jgi:hypothetical protein
MQYGITASMPGIGRSHIPQGTFYGVNEDPYLIINMRPIGLFNNQNTRQAELEGHAVVETYSG